MTFPDDLLKMHAYHRHVTHFAYNISTNTVSDQYGIALITYDENGKILLRIINTINTSPLPIYLVLKLCIFAPRLFRERTGSASNITHITNWTDNESGL